MFRCTTALLPCLLLACAPPTPEAAQHTSAPADSTASAALSPWNADTLIAKGERHFAHLRQLTFGGNNAEAYWSPNGKLLSFQSDYAAWGNACDQIHWFAPMTDDLRKQPPARISVNGGRSTCSYFLPGDRELIYASTHLGGPACPPKPHRAWRLLR